MVGLFRVLLINSIIMTFVTALFFIANFFIQGKYLYKYIYYAWLIIIIGFIFPYRPSFIRLSNITNYFNIKMFDGNRVADGFSISEQGIVIPNKLSNLSVNNPNITIEKLLIVIWIIGIIFTLLYHLISHFKYIKAVSRWCIEIEDKRIIGLFRKTKYELNINNFIGLQKCPLIKSPMLIGFINPKILIPLEFLSECQLYFIFKHELVHYKRKDLWYKGILLFMTALHWFNPIVYIIAKRIFLLCELSCDEEVVKNSSLLERKNYSKTIIIAINNQMQNNTFFSTNFNGGINNMKKRMLSIMKTEQRKKGLLIVLSIAIITISSGVVYASVKSNEVSINNVDSNKEQEQNNLAENVLSKYEQFGVIYDSEKYEFYFGDKVVRCLEDNGGVYNNPDGGEVDLLAIYNGDEIVELRQYSQEEFEARTTVWENNLHDDIKSEAIAEVDSSGISSKQDKESSSSDNKTNDYSIYDEYGLVYDALQDKLIYNEKVVRYFQDIISSNGANLSGGDFTGELRQHTTIDGEIDIYVARDTNGEITGIETYTTKEFDERTKEWGDVERNEGKTGTVNK